MLIKTCLTIVKSTFGIYAYLNLYTNKDDIIKKIVDVDDMLFQRLEIFK